MTAESRRPLFAANGVFAALLAWIYGRELALFLAVRAAPAAAMRELPSLGLVGAALGCALLGLGVMAVGALTQRPASWRGFRLVPIAALLIIFVDFGVLGSKRLPGTPEQLAQLAVQAVAEQAQGLADAAGVPVDGAALEPALSELGPAPYLVRGARVSRWALELRGGCTGPVADAGLVRPGTVIYCAGGDRRRAWLSVVGLRAGERTGEPAVVSLEEPYVVVVDALPRPPGAADGGQ